MKKIRRYLPKGRHLLASLINCKGEILDADFLKNAAEETARESGATVLETIVNVFPNGGITVNVALSESHLALHTYPEFGGLFLDIFTCGRSCDPLKGLFLLKKRLDGKIASQTLLERKLRGGILLWLPAISKLAKR